MIFFLICYFKKIINIGNFRNFNLFIFIIFSLFHSLFVNSKDYQEIITKENNILQEEKENKIKNDIKISNIKWHLMNKDYVNKKEIIWENATEKEYKDSKSITKKDGNIISISSLNRSIVFNDNIIGPDINWLVPPGFKWNSKYKYDFSVRGHNRRNVSDNDPFFGWNSGDAVGQIYYHPLQFQNSSLGLNLGIRSVYEGEASGGATAFGEGLSLGFRYDQKLSDYSGYSLGAEQLLHFDGTTDTGRDIYITISKAWWKYGKDGIFPLYTATGGVGTGKMAEGNIKGLCSDLLGGSGIEFKYKRRLCWSPIFSLSRVHNESFSTFFEYNSKWFLIGNSYSPFRKYPIRGTFAVIISEHDDNYKFKNFNEMKWVFRISMGI